MSHNFNTNSENFYEILGVSKNSSQQEIKKAFNKASLKFHPDKNPGNEKESEEKFKKVVEANSVLGDPEKREKYDKYGKAGLGDDAHMNPDDLQDIINNFFGGNFGNLFGQRHSEDDQIPHVQAVVDVTLEELYKGKSVKQTIERGSLCKICKGVGSEDKDNYECKPCKGAGSVTVIRQMGPMIQQSEQQCNKCDGTGIEKSKQCKSCNGNKGTTEEFEFECDIPAGAFSRHSIVIPNEGNEIPHKSRKGGSIRTNIHLFVREQPHNVFTHMFVIPEKKNEPDPADLLISVEISLAESLCGFVRTIDHLDKKQFNLNYGKIVKHGDILIFPGLGMPVLGNDSGNTMAKTHGNLYVSIIVPYPSEELSSDKKGRLWQLLTDTPYQAKSNKKLTEGITIDKFNQQQSKQKPNHGPGSKQGQGHRHGFRQSRGQSHGQSRGQSHGQSHGFEQFGNMGGPSDCQQS